MDTLSCQKCKSPMALEAIFDHCSVSWPQQRWLWFDCPSCGRGSHIELGKEEVSIGGIDGAPGPCFIQDETVPAPGLQVSRRPGRLVVRYHDREWQIRAR